MNQIRLQAARPTVADPHASDSDASGAQAAAAPPPPPGAAAARAPGARTTRQHSRLASETDASVAPAQDGAGVEASGVVVHAAEVEASAQTGAAPDAEAETTAGISEPPIGARGQRKRGRPRTVAKKQGRLHAPGTYVYDQVEAACQNEQYTCGAVLMPAGHTLEAHLYCNEALTCVAPHREHAVRHERVGTESTACRLSGRGCAAFVALLRCFLTHARS